CWLVCRSKKPDKHVDPNVLQGLIHGKRCGVRTSVRCSKAVAATGRRQTGGCLTDASFRLMSAFEGNAVMGWCCKKSPLPKADISRQSHRRTSRWSTDRRAHGFKSHALSSFAGLIAENSIEAGLRDCSCWPLAQASLLGVPCRFATAVVGRIFL